jgi:Holliday junction resolvase-like predicted endonuclease
MSEIATELETNDSREVLRKILLSVLRSTSDGRHAEIEGLARISRVSISVMKNIIEELNVRNLLFLTYDRVSASKEQRVAIAMEVLKHGGDPERVCRELDWREFEEVAKVALDSNGYSATKSFIFKHGRKRMEIDLVGVKEKLVLCIDCKHWMHGWHRSMMRVAVEKQVKRTEALAAETSRMIKRLNLPNREQFIFLPVLVTLTDVALRTMRDVPVVPILRVGAFLDGLSGMVELPFLNFIGDAIRVTHYVKTE